MGLEHLSAIAAAALRGFAQRGEDELRVGSIEVLAQLLDEADEILLVAAACTALPQSFSPCQKKKPATSYFVAPG